MRVLQVPFTFAPDPVGGTEVYVESLVRGLRAHGVEALVAAPGRPRAYRHDGIPVHRFAISGPALDPIHLYGKGDPVAASAFASLLDELRPDVVHLHAFTAAVSVGCLRQARARGLPVVFTYHTPTVSCVRGTLLQHGTRVCDGALDRARCTACTLDGHGVPRPVAAALARIPVTAGRALGAMGLAGGGWTAVRMPALVEERHRAVRELLGLADRVVALSRWAADLLSRLGVEPARLVRCPHGLPWPARPAGIEAGHPPGPARLVFLGRLDPTKGLDRVLEALRARPELPLSLDVYGLLPEGTARYAERIRRLADADPRVRLRSPVPPEAVVPLLAGYDALIVPSRWLETGPLVVLEAFAAGLPVVGAALGGIAELVTHERDGLLVPADVPDAWVGVLERLAGEPGLLSRLRNGVRPPRPLADVATEMAAVYRGLGRGRADRLQMSHAPA